MIHFLIIVNAMRPFIASFISQFQSSSYKLESHAVSTPVSRSLGVVGVDDVADDLSVIGLDCNIDGTGNGRFYSMFEGVLHQ